jgi:DNA-binding response OmpR family regulator
MVRILIVEDERPLADLLAWAFEQEGYEAVIATNAADGIELGLADPPDLILTDWMLKHSMHGGDVSRAIRDVCPWTKTIIMTGHPEIVSQAWAWRDCIDYVIEKPFHLNSLLAAVRHTLRQSELSAANLLYQ